MASRYALVRLALPGDKDFDIIPLTPEEFAEALEKPVW